MNAADMVLQRSFPTVMVPRREPVAPMQSIGERLLIAQNGVFLEIKQPWISLVRRIADFSVPTAIPYGRVVEHTALHCGRVPDLLVAEFASMARAAHPMETGAWIVWNESTRQFRLVAVKILSHTAGSLNYERPELEPDEVLVVDCHSHGGHKAFFSATDDEDDKHDIKFALVVGNCSSPVASFALRMCAKGVFEDVECVPAAWYELSMVKEAV
ncbi:PRTRC system protein A [Caballeronia sp. 15711]|uniref:PRTRC system protein A n=1 Tax=Caballeronia sp. 15711 TaxID=3391029 RepID=UPI0039E5C713